jgi:antitoxin component of MazEF toxin-antitoxin module
MVTKKASPAVRAKIRGRSTTKHKAGHGSSGKPPARRRQRESARHLTRIGNSYAAIIPRPILALLGIDEDTDLDYRTDGRSLTIVPRRVAEAGDAYLDAAREVMDRHHRALLELAK